jgi:hypothetical protein
VCVCILWYVAYNAHAPYYHLWPAPLYNIFPHNLIKGTIFEQKVTEHKMCVLIFFGKFVSQIYHSKTKRAWYHQTRYISLHVKCPFFLSDLMKLEFPRQIFEKYANTKFHTNPSSWSQVIPCGRTHTHPHDEANSRFSQFCERALKYTKHSKFENFNLTSDLGEYNAYG